MKKILGLILFFTLPSMLAAQTYTPKTVGSKWVFKMGDNSFTDKIIEGTFSFSGKDYFKSLRKYSWGDEDVTYFRVDSTGTVVYLDPKSKLESVDVPGQPKIGDSWVSSDKAWKYEIIDTSATFKTPKQTFKDCLIIKAEQTTNRDKEKLQTYFNYYVKGIGYVGSKVDDGLMAYIESWAVK
ncbi:MAG: hypothetical protein ABI663_12020 [Chryseolinea sp.]